MTTFLRICGDEQHTLLAAHPVTGLGHQIRVHLAWTGHPIDGDPLFSKTHRGWPRAGAAALLAAWLHRRLGGRRAQRAGAAGRRLLGTAGRRAAALPDWDTASAALAASPAALR